MATAQIRRPRKAAGLKRTQQIAAVGQGPLPRNLRAEVEVLNARITKLERAVQTLKVPLPRHSMVVRRSIARAQARKEILGLFAKGKTLYMSEVADRLNIPDEVVVGVCHQLTEAGRLRVDDDALRKG